MPPDHPIELAHGFAYIAADLAPDVTLPAYRRARVRPDRSASARFLRYFRNVPSGDRSRADAYGDAGLRPGARTNHPRPLPHFRHFRSPTPQPGDASLPGELVACVWCGHRSDVGAHIWTLPEEDFPSGWACEDDDACAARMEANR